MRDVFWHFDDHYDYNHYPIGVIVSFLSYRTAKVADDDTVSQSDILFLKTNLVSVRRLPQLLPPEEETPNNHL